LPRYNQAWILAPRPILGLGGRLFRPFRRKSGADHRFSPLFQAYVMRPLELRRRTYVSSRMILNLSQGRADRQAKTLEDAMNWSMYTADRTTHLKIVVVGLIAAILVSVIGISARELNLGTDILTAQAPTVIKAGGPVVYTDRSGATIR
jgi:hypothetical protein